MAAGTLTRQNSNAAPFRAVSALPPCCAEQLHAQPISAVMVGPTSLTTADMGGVLKVWARPEGEWRDEGEG